MASDEFRAFQAALSARPAPPPPGSLVELRRRIDEAMGSIPLADGIEAVALDLGGVAAIECRSIAHPLTGPTVLYFHGGGFRIASALAYRAYGSHLARVIGGRVVLVDYRLAPEHPYPAPLDDAEAAYLGLVEAGIETAGIVVAGDSAGGGLAASLTQRAMAAGLPPAAVVASSPWVDLTVTAGSYTANAATDQLFSLASATEAAALYLGGHDAADPSVSPVRAEWAGAPPMLLQVSATEVLHDDAVLLAEVARSAGVEVTLRVYADMPHVWTLSYPAFPEAVEAVEEIAAFVRRHAA